MIGNITKIGAAVALCALVAACVPPRGGGYGYDGRPYGNYQGRSCQDGARCDNDNNPPGPRGGPGTNWENPPGSRGGPGASPNRTDYDRRDSDRHNHDRHDYDGRN
jgi:hypothetical protein